MHKLLRSEQLKDCLYPNYLRDVLRFFLLVRRTEPFKRYKEEEYQKSLVVQFVSSFYGPHIFPLQITWTSAFYAY